MDCRSFHTAYTESSASQARILCRHHRLRTLRQEVSSNEREQPRLAVLRWYYRVKPRQPQVFIYPATGD